MNPRNTWLLVLVAAGLFAFIYFVEPGLVRPAAVVERVLPAMSTNQVTAIEISPRDVPAIRLERTNGQWHMVKPVEDAVQSYPVGEFLDTLAQLMPHSHLGATELQSHKDVEHEFGFDAPQYTILIEQGDDKSQLKLGNSTEPGDEIFAQVVGNDGVKIIGRDFLKVLPFTADDWRDRTFVRFGNTNINRLIVASSGSTPITFDLDSNALWQITDPIRTPANNWAVKTRLNQVRDARITHFVSGNSSVDLAAIGLQPPQVELKLEDGTNLVASLQFGKTNADGDLYARADPQAPVVLVGSGKLVEWRYGLDAFREPVLVPLADWNIVRRGFTIDASEEGGHPLFSMRTDTNGYVWVTDLSDSRQPVYPVDQDVLVAFFRQLALLQVTNPYTNLSIFAVKDIVQPSDLGDYGLAETNYVRRYQINLTPPGAEPALLVKVDFGLLNPSNTGTMFARRGYLPDDSVYAVKVEDFNRLPTRALDFRSRSVWDFASSNVTQVTVSSGGRSLSLEHRGFTSWAITSGQGISDPQKEVDMEDAVDLLLGSMRAQAWIGRIDKDPPDLGFSDLSLHIEVYLRNGETRRVDFGGGSKYGGRYAAVTLEGQRWLFLFSANDWTKLMRELWMPLGDSETSKERAGTGR